MTSQDEGRNQQHWVAIAEDVFSPAAAWRGQRFSVFFRGAQGDLLLREREGERWTATRSLGIPPARIGRLEAPMPVDWPLSAIATGGDRLDLLARGPEGELLHGTLRGDVWEGFECIGAPQVDGAGAACPAGDLLHRWWNGETWTKFHSLGMPGEPPLPLSGGSLACAWGKWRLDVLARAIDGKLYNVSPIFSPRHQLNSSP
jgi:hypothetical protein